jgi:hypothetical protein
LNSWWELAEIRENSLIVVVVVDTHSIFQSNQDTETSEELSEVEVLRRAEGITIESGELKGV